MEVENCVIVFDDLFGDINFEPLGRDTKNLNSLKKHNYIIITSRDYIFKEAFQQRETSQALEETQLILQEGSYSTVKLEKILINHLDYLCSKTNLELRIQNLVLANKSYITSQLRFPHNIDLFVNSLNKDIKNKTELFKLVDSAKEILTLVESWLKFGIKKHNNILFALAIGGIADLATASDVCYELWTYEKSDIEECISNNQLIVSLEQNLIQFRHPSFRSAILTYCQKRHSQLVSEIILFLTSKNNAQNKHLYRPLIIQFVQDADIAILKLLLSKKLPKKTRPYVWASIIQKDLSYGIDILHRKIKEKSNSTQLMDFIKAKDLLSDKEIFRILEYCLKSRASDEKFYDRIIIYVAYKVRDKYDRLLSLISASTSTDDLYIKMLGVVGSKYPDAVEGEILGYCRHTSTSKRLLAITSLNQLININNHNISAATYSLLLDIETNLKIKKQIRRGRSAILLQNHIKKRNLNRPNEIPPESTST